VLPCCPAMDGVGVPEIELSARFPTTLCNHCSTTMSSDTGGDPNAFLADYKSEGGWYNEQLFGLARYQGMGLGGQALDDIAVRPPF